MCCLKVLRKAACLQIAKRLFQSFARISCHFLYLYGNLRSGNMLHSLYEVLPNLLLKQTTSFYTEPRPFCAQLGAQKNHYARSPVQKNKDSILVRVLTLIEEGIYQ